MADYKCPTVIRLFLISPAVVGHKGSNRVTEFRRVLKQTESGQEGDFCSIEFQELDYDETDGSTVYETLNIGKSLLYVQRIVRLST